MRCGTCTKENDGDAVYCMHCGTTFSPRPSGTAGTGRTAYRYALLLIPAILLASAAGYYKYVLPHGTAAVVNGENILLAEVEGALQGISGGQRVSEETRTRMRYAALSDLINERIAWQAAQQAGISVDADEVQALYEHAQATAGGPGKLDDLIAAQYGSRSAFRAALERKIGIRKFIAERLAAGTTDPSVVDGRVSRWLGEAVSRASVRIALAEQAPASACGCCNPAGRDGASGMSVRQREAQMAVRAYWRARNGEEPRELRSTDLGCHIQVDVMQGDKVARSFRYQNGSVAEM